MLGVHHQMAGGLIGLLFAVWILMQGHPLLAAACFLISVWGATLPDLLDPPGSPFHRSIGHNIVSFILFILLFLISLGLSILFNWWLFIIITSFAAAVLSHLVLDMTTPMGLPLFMGKSIFGIISIPLFLIPWINIIMVIVTLILSVFSIRYLAKKIGGVWALTVLLIPVWGTFLLLGIAFFTVEWLRWLSWIMWVCFVLTLLGMYGVGRALDASLRGKEVPQESYAG